MTSRTFNWSRTAKSSLVKVNPVHSANAKHLLTRSLKQHLVRPSDPVTARPAQALNVRTQQIAEFSGSSESQDRLGHRAKEKLLDRVGGMITYFPFSLCPHANGGISGLGILS